MTKNVTWTPNFVPNSSRNRIYKQQAPYFSILPLLKALSKTLKNLFNGFLKSAISQKPIESLLLLCYFGGKRIATWFLKAGRRDADGK
jgi:hypothetical protein